MRWKEGGGARDGKSKGAKLAAGDGGGGDGGIAGGGGGGISRRISIGCAREAKWVEVDRGGRRRTLRREEEEEKKEREKERLLPQG